MHLIPFVASLLVALAIVPAIVAALGRSGVVRENYRGITVPSACGVAIIVAALIVLGPLAAIDELGDGDILRGDLGRVLLYVLGVAVLGLIDDLLGGRAAAGVPSSAHAPRGWRGHARAITRGQLSTGALKAIGALGLALYVLSGQGQSWGEYLVSVGLLLLATNLFNLLDLRPGRAIKSLALLGAVLTIATWDIVPLETFGLLLGPMLVLAPYDLSERAMLGDAGSNVLGAVAGFWLIAALSTTGEAVALAALVSITVYAEFRSLSALVERNPLLRRLDSLGRLKTPVDSHLDAAQGGTGG